VLLVVLLYELLLVLYAPSDCDEDKYDKSKHAQFGGVSTIFIVDIPGDEDKLASAAPGFEQERQRGSKLCKSKIILLQLLRLTKQMNIEEFWKNLVV
jgi:hypothetical protein